MFKILGPLNDKWRLHERWIELRLVKELKHLAEAKRNHLFEVTQHLLGTANLVEVLQHGDHHFEIVWLLVLDGQLQSNVVHLVFWTQDEKRHAPDRLLIELVLVTSLDVLMVN